MEKVAHIQELEHENARLREQVQQQEKELEELRKAKGNWPLIDMSAIGTLSASMTGPTPITIPQLNLQPEFQPKSDDQYHINDLLRYHDDQFVQNAYRAILKRMPGEREYHYYIESLRSGRFNKIDILAGLRFSAEGKAKKVRIKGLMLPTRVRQIGRLPVLGYLVRLVSALGRLPIAIRNQQQFEVYSLMLHQQIADHINQVSAGMEENIRSAQVEQEEVRQRMGLFGLRVRELEEKHRSVREQVEGLTVRFERGQEEVQQKEQFLARRLEEEGERLTESVKNLKEGMGSLSQRHRELFRRYEELCQENILQKRRLDLILTELKRKAGLDGEAVQTMAVQSERLLDHAYFLFENRFRGPQEEIRRRQESYLPTFQAYLHADSPLLQNGGFVLDLGCGRGEMLEVLRDAGIPAQGVDMNEDMVYACRQKGLEVVQDDLFHYLASLPDESLAGAISCQVIEHLSAQQNIELLKLLFAKLRWSGRLVLETVNPENLLVSSLTFYEDLSHRLKIPAASLSFLAECLGFTVLETRYLMPSSEEECFRLIDGDNDSVVEAVNENFERLSAFFFGPHDYALICQKGEG